MRRGPSLAVGGVDVGAGRHQQADITGVIKFLHENGVDLTRKDSRGLTPLQTALGEAGGFGFGGRAGVVREETARVIAELIGVPLPDAGARTALVAAAPQGGPTQDDDPDT